MRPTGRVHLGHYHGVIKQWVDLQVSHDCFFFVADWHALTTRSDPTQDLKQPSIDMVIDWIACGINPGTCKIFFQSQIPYHAELNLLLSMITPLSWLERIPSYKDLVAKSKQPSLSASEEEKSAKDWHYTTYGFLGYPLLQCADILAYKGDLVPVGEDQVSHIELTREIARRFNHLFGGERNFVKKCKMTIKKLDKKTASMYKKLRALFQEKGDVQALKMAVELVEQNILTLRDKERLRGYLEGSVRLIFPEPQSALNRAPKLPGTDGRKMSKSYSNTITLRDENTEIRDKILTMPTDPARIRRKDSGNPDVCPVWKWHEVYSDDERKKWVREGCTKAKIGCVDCKNAVIPSVQDCVSPIRERAKELSQDKHTIKSIIAEGTEAAREQAKKTLEEASKAMGIR